MLSLDDIRALFDRHGEEQYSGEPVTQLEHALQTALLAEDEGAGDALVTASLLHDLGHLLHEFGDTPTLRGIDDTHQYRALPVLRGLFGHDVLAPIRLHVDAKRWLCHADPVYHDALSDDSKRSLVLQGGVFDATAAARFMARAGAPDAVRLRRWDDQAKTEGLTTPPLSHFLERAAHAVQSSRTAPA